MQSTLKLQKLIYGAMVAAMVLCLYFAYSAPKALASPAYDYKYITQSPYPSNLTPGQVVNVWVEVKNTGTKTWKNDGVNPVRLGAGSSFGSSSQSRDYSSEFYNSAGWLSANRTVAIRDGVILPGWHTRFEFTIKAPSANGSYKAYFTPVAEGATWMKDIGMYWGVTVGGGSSDTVITPPTGTGLAVSLASDSPVAGSVAQAAQNAVFSKINLTAGSGSAVTVSSIKVKRGGVSTDTSISSIKLYDGSTQVGSTQSLNTMYATFSQLALAIPAGTTKTLSIKANLSSTATASSSISLGINAVAM